MTISLGERGLLRGYSPESSYYWQDDREMQCGRDEPLAAGRLQSRNKPQAAHSLFLSDDTAQLTGQETLLVALLRLGQLEAHDAQEDHEDEAHPQPDHRENAPRRGL